MKNAIKQKSWCNNPDPEYARELNDLYKVGNRVDAWRDFFQSEACAAIKRLDGHVIWFNKYEHFEKMICLLDCAEGEANTVIEGLMRPGHGHAIEFLRGDIYDNRAWCKLPLSCFVATEGFNERTSDRDMWQHEVLTYNQMPVLQFGIKKPWTVSRDCFTFSQKIKHGERFAQISFCHPQQDSRFEGRRWAADGAFPKTTTKQQMEETLFAKVEAECAKHQTFIETKA